MIAALEKAEAIARHRAYLGCQVHGWEIGLTLPEARELLEWFLCHHEYSVNYLEDLRRLRRDPFRAFEETGTLLEGLPITRLQ